MEFGKKKSQDYSANLSKPLNLDGNSSNWQLLSESITDKLLPVRWMRSFNAGCKRCNEQADGTQSPNVNAFLSGL